MTGRTATFSKLGDWGQSGNQLFHIAVVLGYAARHGARPCLPPWRCTVTGRDYERDFPAFGQYRGSFSDGELYQEPSFGYVDIPPARHIDLRGNFQCCRYFEDCEDDIRALLVEPPCVRDELDRTLAALGIADFAAMHVRFYAHATRDKGKGPVEALPLGYYARALQRLGSDLPVFIATDNRVLLAAALQRIRPAGRIILSEFDDHLLDFFMLSRARRLAIANSSFSWWAAWLGRSKDRVVAPHRFYWFNSEVRADPFWVTRDLYPRHFLETAW